MHIYIWTINQTKLIYYWILTFLKFKYITFVSNYAFVLSHCEFLTTDKNCFEIPGAGCINDLYVYIQKPCVRLFPRTTHYIIIKEECEYFTYSIIHLTESMCTHVFFFVNLYSFMHLTPGDPKLLLCAWVSVVLMTLNWLGLNWGQSRESKHPAASANQRNKASEYRTEICLQRHPQSSTCSNPNYLCEWVCFGVWPFVGKVASCSRIKNNFEAQVANWIMCISSCNVTSLLIHWNAWNQQLL